MTHLSSFWGFAFLHLVRAAPTQNLTALRNVPAPAWVPDPDERGTWSLLYSCVFTLTLCVWSASHPNLPNLIYQGSLIKHGAKAIFVLYTLLAPEYGVSTAFQQYLQARRLINELMKLKAQHALEDSNNYNSAVADESDSYSLIYGFYVLMGGLAVDLSPIHDKVRIVLLTPMGVLQLARKGYFINVSDEDIKDKSKANLLAKGLVLLQISWMMFQCISRKAAGLPISVLEVHTLVHAACALIMYCLWFKKPMDVEEPTIISTAGFESEIALMLVRNHHCGVQPNGNLVLPQEFIKARYAGVSYQDWPGLQGSEASYLVFNPSQGEIGHHSMGTSISSVVHPGESADPCQREDESLRRDVDTTSCQISSTSNCRRLAPVNTSIHPSRGHLASVSTSQSLPSEMQRTKTANSGGYKSNKLMDFVAPSVVQRRRAAHDYSLSRLVDNALAEQYTAAGQDVWLGFHSCPPMGVPTKLSVSTGETIQGGIGPNAFMVGSWISEQPLPIVREVSEHLKQQLPLYRIDCSSVAFYCALKISLSQKDLKRWQLASQALRKEYPSPSIDGHQKDRLLDFSGPGGSISDVFFIASRGKVSWAVDGAAAVRFGDRNRHVLFIQRVYHHFVDNKNIRRPTAFMVFVGVSIFYAALHLALWNYGFPTAAEKLLWRISASILLFFPILVLLFLLASLVYQRIFPGAAQASRKQLGPHFQAATLEPTPIAEANVGLPTGLEGNATPPISSCNKAQPTSVDGFLYPTPNTVSLIEWGAIAAFFLAAFYIFSRIFIIVESFLSLRRVPLGVYVGIGWSKYIPHL
ncbi:MAG: hypothetical protein Q9216_003272 [Gyalolechia sp. 2 TL-2023]